MPQEKNLNWYMPAQVIFGAGRLAELAEVIAEINASRVLLVTGASSMAHCGARKKVEEILKDRELTIHDGVRVNLPLDDADRIIKKARDCKAEAVIGLGGGSVLDGAKAAALLAPGNGFIRDYLAGQTAPAGIPFISIPTTSGTGSEVTPYMIFMDPEKRRKLSYGPKQALARFAIVDPELTLTLPKDQTAATGLDALSHCLESIWSKRATPLSDLLALDGLTAILDNLQTAVENPRDLDARVAMSYGSLAAGFALAQTATAAVHGITYPLTALYGVTHGIACAFMLREIMRVNFHHLPHHKQIRLLHHMRANTLSAAIGILTDLLEKLGVPETLEQLGVPESDIDRMVSEVTGPHLERNAAPLTKDRIRELWRQKLR